MLAYNILDWHSSAPINLSVILWGHIKMESNYSTTCSDSVRASVQNLQLQECPSSRSKSHKASICFQFNFFGCNSYQWAAHPEINQQAQEVFQWHISVHRPRRTGLVQGRFLLSLLYSALSDSSYAESPRWIPYTITNCSWYLGDTWSQHLHWMTVLQQQAHIIRYLFFHDCHVCITNCSCQRVVEKRAQRWCQLPWYFLYN